MTYTVKVVLSSHELNDPPTTIADLHRLAPGAAPDWIFLGVRDYKKYPLLTDEDVAEYFKGGGGDTVFVRPPPRPRWAGLPPWAWWCVAAVVVILAVGAAMVGWGRSMKPPQEVGSSVVGPFMTAFNQLQSQIDRQIDHLRDAANQQLKTQLETAIVAQRKAEDKYEELQRNTSDISKEGLRAELSTAQKARQMAEDAYNELRRSSQDLYQYYTRKAQDSGIKSGDDDENSVISVAKKFYKLIPNPSEARNA